MIVAAKREIAYRFGGRIRNLPGSAVTKAPDCSSLP